MPVGLVTLSCWKSVWTGMLSWACSVPSRASPRMLSSVACMAKPSRAELRAGGRALQCRGVCRAPIYGQALRGPPGSQPCLPPVPLCKLEQDRALKPKGKQGIL